MRDRKYLTPAARGKAAGVYRHRRPTQQHAMPNRQSWAGAVIWIQDPPFFGRLEPMPNSVLRPNATAAGHFRSAERLSESDTPRFGRWLIAYRL